MITGILVTDDGAHSAEDWALASAAMLVQAFEVQPGSPRRAQIEIAKDRVRARITEIFLELHSVAQKEEKVLLKKDIARTSGELVADEHVDVDSAVTNIRAAFQPLLDILETKEVTKGVFGANIEHLTFEDHLMRVIRERVEMDLRSVMDIERSWHKDRNPEAVAAN